jgi:hypothetical protein
MNKLLITAAKGCLWITATFAAIVLLHGLSYAADITAHGMQTRGHGTDGKLSGEGFSVPSGKTGSITGAECDGDGFWVEGGGAGVRRFKTANAAIGATFSPGSYRVYPNLKKEQEIAGVTITVRIFGTITAGGGVPPPPGLRNPLQVRHQTFSPAVVLEPGMYNIWVRVGEYAPGQEVDSNNVTAYGGGTWTKYSNVNFSPGGKPRHVTIFPDQVRDSIYFTDFNDPRYGTPGPNEFILHVDNRSLRDTVTYVFQRTGTGESSDPSPSGGVPTGTVTTKLAGVWTGYMAGKMSGQSQVLQTGRSLTFINEFGSRSQGTFKNETTVVATDWEGGLHGQLVEGGRRINWANNTWWILKESSNKR